MVNYLFNNYQISDPYMCLADFDSYFTTYKSLLNDYKNRNDWTKKAMINISKAGFFSSDRSVNEYCERIWNLKQIEKAG